ALVAGAIVAGLVAAHQMVGNVRLEHAVAHAGASAGIDEGGIVHGRQLDVDEAGAANGANGGRQVAVKQGTKPGDRAFGGVLEDPSGVVEPSLGANVQRRGVGDFYQQRPLFQQGRIFHNFA